MLDFQKHSTAAWNAAHNLTGKKEVLLAACQQMEQAKNAGHSLPVDLFSNERS